MMAHRDKVSPWRESQVGSLHGCKRVDKYQTCDGHFFSTKSFISLYTLLFTLLLISTAESLAQLSSASASASASASVHQSSNILQANSADDEQSQQQVTGDIVAIKEGADLDLSCPIVVPNEDMIISWTCDNEPANIRSSRIHVTDSGKLRIRSAKLGDSCNYRCEAANGYGTLSVVIKVIIVDRRLIDQLARRQNATASSRDNHESLLNLLASSKSKLASTLTSSRVHEVATKSSAPSQQQATGQKEDLNIELEIEPSKLIAKKNSTFSLECRIKYAPHARVPQIIWLKEFMGDRPATLLEAIEQNLILLDNVYYHSLNWPRSITYSEKSQTANSALLVRHSNYVHSGRYVCLAGYPSTLVSLQHDSGSTTASGEPDDPMAFDELSRDAARRAAAARSPLNYKLAQAQVLVDDNEGLVRYQMALKANAAGGKRQVEPETNFLSNVISSNTWLRNVTILLIIICAILALIKFIQLKRQQNRKSHNGGSSVSPAQQVNSNPNQRQRIDNATNNGQLSELVLNQSATFTRTPISAGSMRENFIRNTYIDQSLLNDKLAVCGRVCEDEHVYSEIGYGDSLKQQQDTSEPYYKQPRGVISKNVGE